MTRFHVDSDALLSATSTATATIARMQSDATSLNSQLSGLSGAWTGAAATSFQAQVTDWMATYTRVEQNLAALSQMLGQAGRQYAETEQAAAQLFLR